ncbi:MAG: hypothetical protein U0Y10_14065 [Spirosomataceae bacterium]
MSSFRVRPKFKITTEKSIHQLLELIEHGLKTTQAPIEGAVSNTHGFIFIKESEQHYWSPQLSFSFEETPDQHTIVRGTYGPHQKVWLSFVFGYAVSGLGIFFLSMYGLSRYYLGLDTQVLWVIPILAGIIVALWFMAQFGQKVGAEQTYLIHHFFEESIHERIHISRIL